LGERAESDDAFIQLLVIKHVLSELILLVLKLVLHGLFLLLNLSLTLTNGAFDISRSGLQADAGFNVLCAIFEEVFIKHQVMLFNIFVEGNHGGAGNILGLSDESTEVHKFFFVGRALANLIFHVLIGLVNKDNLLATPGINGSDKVVLNFSSLLF
jgi:hypothetical protein